MSARVTLVILATILTIVGLPSIITTTSLSPTATAQSNTAPSTTTNRTTTTTATLPAASSSNQIFYLFTAEHDGVNETKLGVPPDTFSPDVLAVNEGNNVTIHFYNLDATDRHTFTMGAPYNLNKDLLPGQNTTFTFKAGNEGVFKFYCTYHQPTMAGQLIVLPPPSVEKATATTK
jgi:plastocyanin